MIVGIIEHEYRTLAPLAIERVKMLYHLDDEQTEGVAVGDASVRSKPHLTCTTHRSDDVERL